MSFLTRSYPIARQAIARPSPRLFSTAIVNQKSATETVKDGLKAVDRTVSDAAVKGIDKGIEVKNSAASTVSSNASKASGEAQEKAGVAQGKAAQLGSEAQGKAAELTGKAKGAAAEVKGEVKGKL